MFQNGFIVLSFFITLLHSLIHHRPLRPIKLPRRLLLTVLLQTHAILSQIVHFHASTLTGVHVQPAYRSGQFKRFQSQHITYGCLKPTSTWRHFKNHHRVRLNRDSPPFEHMKRDSASNPRTYFVFHKIYALTDPR